MSRTIVGLASLVVACVITAGCLKTETTPVLYIEPDGSATWTVLEKDVVSDDPKEEAEYMAAVVAEQHPVARAFQALGALRVRTEILRRTRPYAVYTEATFGRFDELMETLAWTAGLEARSQFEMRSAVDRRGSSATWTLTIHGHHDEPHATDSDRDALDSLLWTFGACRFVVAKGRFTSAAFFEIRQDGRVATMKDLEEADVPNPLVLSLTWTNAER